MKENQRELLSHLGAEGKEIFSRIIDAQEELLEAGRKAMFIRGFQIGMGLAADALLVPPEALAREV